VGHLRGSGLLGWDSTSLDLDSTPDPPLCLGICRNCTGMSAVGYGQQLLAIANSGQSMIKEHLIGLEAAR
jgi:hypothetical protein